MFYGVHAAYLAAVLDAVGGCCATAHTQKESNFLGHFAVGRLVETLQHKSFKLNAGNYIRVETVTIVCEELGIDQVVARANYDASHFKVYEFFFLREIYCSAFTEFFADSAYST